MSPLVGGSSVRIHTRLGQGTRFPVAVADHACSVSALSLLAGAKEVYPSPAKNRMIVLLR